MSDAAKRIGPYFYTPGGIVVILFILISISNYAFCWLAALYSLQDPHYGGPSRTECRAQLETIRRRLKDGEAERTSLQYPEGVFFCYSFYGFDLIDLALMAPDDTNFRDHAMAELERIIPTVDERAGMPPFLQCQSLVPKGGVIPAGHSNLLRAGYIILGGKNKDLTESFHKRSAELYQVFQASHDGFLSSYPKFMIWPVDNCCALESLRLHDKIYGSHYSTACDRAAAWLSNHLDAQTGLMPAQIDEKGNVMDGPRGCALSWSLALMPNFAPELAHAQYERFRTTWFIPVLGTAGIREWPVGRDGSTNTDTGAVLGGIGAAASGLGIAAARANDDMTGLLGLLRGLSALGFPMHSIIGERFYFARSFLLADELALWGTTISQWDNSASTEYKDKWPPLALGNYWIVLALATVIAATVVGVLIFFLCKWIRGFLANPQKWSMTSAMFLVIQLAALLVWIFVPQLSWMMIMSFVVVTDFVERAFVRANVIKMWPE